MQVLPTNEDNQPFFSKSRGRPKNPYRHCARIWTVDNVETSFWHAACSRAGVVSPKDVDEAIIRLFSCYRVALCRSVVQSFLHLLDVSPVEVTASLNRLSSGLYLPETLLTLQAENFGEQREHNIYALNRPPSELEITILRKCNETKRYALTSNVLGRVGEHFVRSHLIASARFSSVSRKTKLGREHVQEKHALDLIVYLNGHRLGISVKNQYKAVHSGAYGSEHGKEIRDVIEKCKAHSEAGYPTFPWLITCFVTPEAIEYCRKHNVGLSVLGFQVLPRRLKMANDRIANSGTVIDTIRPVIGPRAVRVFGTRIESVSSSETHNNIRRLLDPIMPPTGFFE